MSCGIPSVAMVLLNRRSSISAFVGLMAEDRAVAIFVAWR